MRHLLVFIILAGSVLLRSSEAHAAEFWPVVREVLEELGVYDEDSFQRRCFSRAAWQRLAGIGETFPNWTTVAVGMRRETSPHSKTVRQMHLLFSPATGRRVLCAAQRDRRRELGLDPYAPPVSPLLRFIEDGEIARTLPFQTRRKIYEGPDAWNIAPAVAERFLTEDIPLKEPRFRGAIEKISAWLNAQVQIDSTAREPVSRYLESRLAPIPVPVPVLEKIEKPSPIETATERLKSEASRSSLRSDFSPGEIRLNLLQFRVLSALREGPVTGSSLRVEVYPDKSRAVDAGQFSRAVVRMVQLGLVIETTVGNFKMYALTNEGHRVLESRPELTEECNQKIGFGG